MEVINTFLSGIFMPVLLMGAGIFFAFRLRLFYIFHPIRFFRTLADAHKGGGVSPFRALSQALAGTLGVGNMAGVATAIVAGGPGAIFWMWISALCAMSVKYAEVRMAVDHRRTGPEGFYGGAMYYIRDVFGKNLPRIGAIAGGGFAVLCVANSLMTGNIVQMYAAASVFPWMPPLILGGIVAALAFVIACGGAGRVSEVTMGLIPFLSGAYILISVVIIIRNGDRLPAVLHEIIASGLSLRAAAGGTAGFAVNRAIRFGVTRGIFSNEAGCGTSPTAHAAANTRSAHHQGCFGVFEVFADTIVLCSMTAFVILLSDGVEKGMDGIPLTLYAYTALAGKGAGFFIGISVILFAFATVICQTQYGAVAIGYFTQKKGPHRVYLMICALCSILGTVIAEGLMWQTADLIVSLMTALNVICLLWCAKREGILQVPSEEKKKKRRLSSVMSARKT